MKPLDPKVILEAARRVLSVEELALRAVRDRVGEEFVQAVQLLLACKGRVVFTGMGKSGLVCRKVAATFSSTGTPSFFLHPAEGEHGDLGMLAREDLLVAVSSSGETREVLHLLPAVKRLAIPVVALTGNPSSTLARRADVVLDISVREEACPLGLAPTASTTATMALGDALAVALLELRGFTEADFAFCHPGGSLGRRLLAVSDVMHTGEGVPRVGTATLVREAILEISSKKLGLTTVVDGAGRLVGILTDGDLRRLLQRERDPLDLRVEAVMTRTPKVVEADALAARALELMERHAITALVVQGGEGQVVGVLHLHDILRAGVA